MTPLHDFVTSLGATFRPHPATEPAPGSAGLVVVTPSDTWLSVDDLMLDEPRTNTAAAVLVAPRLARDGFVPNVVATASIIAPAVPVAGLFEAVAASMESAEDWRLRARSVTSTNNDDDEDRTLDLLGEYRVDGITLALSSLVRARIADGVTVLHQTHVTTFADQISEHTSGLAAARIT